MTHHRSHAHQSRWPWAVIVALLASIPAFYDSLMPHPAVWANGLYVISGLVLFGSVWHATRAAPLAWLRMEFFDSSAPAELRLTLWPGGAERVLARAHPHGEWVEWLD